MNKLLIASLALTVALPAWSGQINKCTLPGGKVVFQETPCAGGKGETLTVRPAAGHARAASAASTEAEGKLPMTEAQRIEQRVQQSQQERRRRELEERLVPDAKQAIDNHRAACDRELGALRAQKSRANNNLAGATWEGAISGEMTAVATRCDTRAKELREDADRLAAECRKLGGCRQ